MTQDIYCLSPVSSVFDLIGLFAPFTFHRRLLKNFSRKNEHRWDNDVESGEEAKI